MHGLCIHFGTATTCKTTAMDNVMNRYHDSGTSSDPGTGHHEEPEEITVGLVSIGSQKHHLSCAWDPTTYPGYCLQGCSELANDRLQQSHQTVRCFQCNKTRYVVSESQGNASREKPSNVSLLPREIKNEILQTIDIFVNAQPYWTL